MPLSYLWSGHMAQRSTAGPYMPSLQPEKICAHEGFVDKCGPPSNLVQTICHAQAMPTLVPVCWCQMLATFLSTYIRHSAQQVTWGKHCLPS